MMATKPRPPASSEATETSKKPAANAEEAIQELERRLVDLGSADGEMALATADATPPAASSAPANLLSGNPPLSAATPYSTPSATAKPKTAAAASGGGKGALLVSRSMLSSPCEGKEY